MKTQYKLILFFMIAALSFVGCSDELIDMNEDPNSPTAVPGGNLITQAQYNMYDRLHGRLVNAEWGMLMVQQWAQNEYTAEQRYQSITGVSFDNFFQDIYINTLKELDAAQQLTAEAALTEVQKADLNGVAEILAVDGWMALSDGFGSLPYLQSMKPNEFPNPAYNTQEEIYLNLLERLDVALGSMSDTGSFDGDLIYGGDISQWKKFGASLMLQAAIRISDRNSGVASNYANTAIDYGVFESNEDNAVFVFDANPALSNPLYIDETLNARDDFCVSELLVEWLKDTEDPRLPEYVAPNQFGEYEGMPYGLEDGPATNLKPNTSRPADRIRTATAPHFILTYSEVEFLIAEAIERGYLTGSAATAYNNAVTASMNQWDITDATEIADYLAGNPYNSAQWDQSIGEQKWLALYTNGHEAWTEWRRLGYPQLSAPADAVINTIPVKLPYPQSEQSNNSSSLNEVTSDPNSITTPVWWDVN